MIDRYKASWKKAMGCKYIQVAVIMHLNKSNTIKSSFRRLLTNCGLFRKSISKSLKLIPYLNKRINLKERS